MKVCKCVKFKEQNEFGEVSLPELTEEQIRKDNPHFGPVIRLIDEGPYHSGKFDFTYFKTVGAYRSKHEGEPEKLFDAWATYLWSPRRNKWVLGAN